MAHLYRGGELKCFCLILAAHTHTHSTHIIIILCVKHRRWHFVWSSVEIRTVEASWACVFLHIPWPTLLIRCVNLINIMDNCLHGRELRQPPCSDRMCKYCSFTIGALNTDICRNALKSHLQMTPGLLGLHLSFWWICSLSLMESEKAFCTSSYHLTAVATHPRGGGTSTNKDTIPCNHMLTDSAYNCTLILFALTEQGIFWHQCNGHLWILAHNVTSSNS